MRTSKIIFFLWCLLGFFAPTAAQQTFSYNFQYDAGKNRALILDAGGQDVTARWDISVRPDAQGIMAGSEYFLSFSTGYRTAELTHTALEGITEIRITSPQERMNDVNYVSVYVGGEQAGKTTRLQYASDPLVFKCEEAGGTVKIVFGGEGEDNRGFSLMNVSIKALRLSDGEVRVAAPTLSIADGETFSEPTRLALSAEDGAEIFYTLDGSDPREAGALRYGQPILLDYGTTTVRAAAKRDGTFSDVVSATYIVAAGFAYAPVSIEEILSGTPFIIASGADRRLVAAGFTGKEIRTTRTEADYALFHAVPSGKSGYYYLLDGENNYIGIRSSGETDLDGSNGNNRYWYFEAAGEAADGQIKIKNMVGENGSERYLAFSGNVVKYYTPYGADGVPCLLKRVPEAAGSFTVSGSGYATYYTDHAFIMPEGVTGGYVTEEIETLNAGEAPTYKLSYNWAYAPGDTVPALTPLVLRADDAGAGKEYAYEQAGTDKTAPQDNMLHGSLTDGLTSVPGDNYYYQLSYNNDEERVLGFWWAAADGGAFTNAAHKAYLAIPKDHAYDNHALGFDIGGITGIAAPQTRPDGRRGAVYRLDGRRLPATGIDRLPPGLYIIDGRKILVR